MGFFKKLKTLIVGKSVKVDEKYAKTLTKSKNSFKNKLRALFARYAKVDEEFFEELEEFLIESDVGASLSYEIIKNIKAQVRLNKIQDPKDILDLLIETLYYVYDEGENINFTPAYNKPHVILVVGVNGSGKTTSIAKLASYYKGLSLDTLLVAADTFRAGAVEQLDMWAKRLNLDIVEGKENSDPSSVIYDGISKGLEMNKDVIICDTAGRLHTKVNLMQELGKMTRVLEKRLGRGPDEVLLVIDATTGQNGIYQAKAFLETTNVTSIILSKMDGTSKGGIILAIKDQLNLKVKYLGLGESAEDLEIFDINSYLHNLFEGLIE